MKQAAAMLQAIPSTSISARAGYCTPIYDAITSRFNVCQTPDMNFQSILIEGIGYPLSLDHYTAMDKAIRLVEGAVAIANVDDKPVLLAIQQQIHSIQQKFVTLEALLDGSQSVNERDFETQASITGHIELSNLLHQLDQLQNSHRARETQADKANREKLASDIKKYLVLGWLVALIYLLLFTKSGHSGYPLFSALSAEIGEMQKKLQQPLQIEDNDLVALNKTLTSVCESFKIWSKVAPLERKNKALNEHLENLDATVHLLRSELRGELKESLRESLTKSITASVKESLTASLKEQYDHQLASHGQQLEVMKESLVTSASTADQLKESMADLRNELTISHQEQQEMLMGFGRWLLRVEDEMERQRATQNGMVAREFESVRDELSLLQNKWRQSQQALNGRLEVHQELMNHHVEKLVEKDGVRAEMLHKFYELYLQTKPKRKATNADQQVIAAERSIEVLLNTLKIFKDTERSTTHETRALQQVEQAPPSFFLEKLKRRMFSAERLTSIEKALNFSRKNKIDVANSHLEAVQTDQIGKLPSVVKLV